MKNLASKENGDGLGMNEQCIFQINRDMNGLQPTFAGMMTLNKAAVSLDTMYEGDPTSPS